MKNKKLVVIGDSYFAQVAYEYFTQDSDYTVKGFAVEKSFRKSGKLFGVPVVDFEEIEQNFSPDDHEVFVALTYRNLNRTRARLLKEAKARNYKIASYVSSEAFVWPNAKMGENCFIFEKNVVQPFVTIGDNVILWSGNHVGHHSKIGDHVFISSHVVISGLVEIGSYCFLGVNTTVTDNVKIEQDCWLAPGSLVTSDLSARTLLKTKGSKPSPVDTHRFFRLQKSNAA